MSGTAREAARYRFGDSSRSGMLLGLSLRQGAPLVAGMLWLALALMIELPLVGLVGLALASVASFGRWRHAPRPRTRSAPRRCGRCPIAG